MDPFEAYIIITDSQSPPPKKLKQFIMFINYFWVILVNLNDNIFELIKKKHISHFVLLLLIIYYPLVHNLIWKI